MASQPPPYGFGPPGQPVPPPPTVPGAPPSQPPAAPPPGFGQPPTPPMPPTGPPPGFGAAPPPSPPPKRNLTALWVVLGAVVIAALVAGAIVAIGGGSDSDDTVDTTRPRRTTTTTEPRTTDAPTTSTSQGPRPTSVVTLPTDTSGPPATTLPVDGSGIDLGHGVTMPLPAGWERTDGPEDDVVQISTDTLKVDAQAVQRDVGEDPAAVMQEYTDLFDGDFDAIGYSPATLRGTTGTDGELRTYGLYYRAIDADYTGFDGAIYLLQRDDGLAVLLDYYAERGADSMGLPENDYDSLIQSVLDAPQLGTPADTDAVGPFRLTTAHPVITVDGLAAFTLPPGWADQSVPGATILSNGIDETVVALKVAAQPDATTAAAAVQADLAARYPGFTFEAPITADAWANLERIDIDFSSPGDPAIDPRPRNGVITLFYDPSSTNGLSFSRFWYGDVSSDGSDPNGEATDFLFGVYTDSFDVIP